MKLFSITLDKDYNKTKLKELVLLYQKKQQTNKHRRKQNKTKKKRKENKTKQIKKTIAKLKQCHYYGHEIASKIK